MSRWAPPVMSLAVDAIPVCMGTVLKGWPDAVPDMVPGMPSGTAAGVLRLGVISPLQLTPPGVMFVV